MKKRLTGELGVGEAQVGDFYLFRAKSGSALSIFTKVGKRFVVWSHFTKRWKASQTTSLILGEEAYWCQAEPATDLLMLLYNIPPPVV